MAGFFRISGWRSGWCVIANVAVYLLLICVYVPKI